MFALVAAALAAPPPSTEAPLLCVCTENSRKADIEFRGVAIDAVLTADPSGAKVEARQATMFRVLKTIKGEAKTPMKVWHVADPQKCGVTFNYAAIYNVRARTKKGVVETDLCLMPELKPKAE